MRNYLLRNKHLLVISGLLILCAGCGSWKAQPSTKTVEPRHLAWGVFGDKGYSEEVIMSYNWMVVDTDKYVCKEK